MAKMVAIAIYDGFQLLDATGPAQVFASANAMSGKVLYDVKMVANSSGRCGSRRTGSFWSTADPVVGSSRSKLS